MNGNVSTEARESGDARSVRTENAGLNPMIDAAGRERAAVLIERFMRSEISNNQLEEQWPQSDDVAIEQIRLAVWYTYDDLYDHRGPLGDREMLQRCAAFLRTSQPYTWRVPTVWERLVGTSVGIATLGLVKFKSTGPELDAPWPFNAEQIS